jgi:hypothetical protein
MRMRGEGGEVIKTKWPMKNIIRQTPEGATQGEG